jgi:hypothetical protein
MAEIKVVLVNGELAGKSAQSIAKEITNAAQAAKKAEVGTKAWVDAHKKLDDAKKLQVDLRKQIEGTTSASDMLKTAWNKLPGAQYFNQVADSFGLMKKGVGGLISQMGILKTAIASTGIGLLVLALGALVTWFTKTEEGADKLKSVLYPLQALFKMITGLVADLGGKIFKRLAEAIENPTQALKDLGNVIVENVINRFKALAVIGGAIVKLFKGDWKQGLKELADGHIQLATGITNATDKMNTAFQETKKVWDAAWEAGKKLLELENEIEDAEAALLVTRAKLNVAAAQAMELAKDITEEDEIRLKAAQKYQQIINQQTKAEENLLLLKQKRMLLEQNLDGILTDDEKLERSKMEADIIQLQADNIEKRKKARALELGLIQEIADREVEIAKNIAQLKVEASQDGFQQEIAQIQEQTEEKIAALQGSEAQITEQTLLLKEIELQKMQAVVDKYAKEAADKKQAELDKKAAADKKASEEAIENAKKEALAKEEVEQAYRDFQSGALGELINALGEDEKARKKNANAIKTFTKAKILVDLQSEIAGLNASPGSTFTLGAAGAIKAAIAAIRAGLAIRKVDKEKFGLGGIPSGVLRGPSHSQGGIPLVAEGDEIIMTKGVYRDPRLRSMASQLNVAGGGRSFAAGGPVNPLDNSRGPVNRAGDPAAFFDYAAMARANSQLIDEKIARIRVENVATQTQDVLNTINTIQEAADF